MARRMMALLALVAAVALVAAACGGGDDGDGEEGGGEGGTIQIGGQDVESHGEEDITGATSLELEADDFYFEPTVIKADAGAEVTVTINNEGDAPHNFSVDGQNVDTDIDSGSSAEATVTIPDSGTLVFVCKFHESQGMVGQFEVA